jgi:hypothetical protein
MAISTDGQFLEFARFKLASVDRRTPDDVVIEGIHRSNTWTAVATHAVFRIGVTVTLDPSQEASFWQIGVRCGALTPVLLNFGKFVDEPYMLTSRVRGTHPKAAPPQAGKFLRLLHEYAPDGFGPKGNWPPRRDHRFSTAIAYLQGRWPEKRALLRLIDLASVQFAEEKICPNHGDFRTENMLTDPGGGFGLVDWTDAHLGSREEDLGGCDPELIPEIVRSYQGDAPVALSREKIAGHSYARVLSLMAAGVLPQESLGPTECALSDFLSHSV